MLVWLNICYEGEEKAEQKKDPFEYCIDLVFPSQHASWFIKKQQQHTYTDTEIEQICLVLGHSALVLVWATLRGLYYIKKTSAGKFTV